MRLTPHFTLKELTVSQTATRLGLNNEPTEEHIENLTALCSEILEPLRMMLGKPVIVTSGYRCHHLNALIGGSPTSQHKLGEAADIWVPGMSTEDLMGVICESFDHDQVIDEFGRWVHISFVAKYRSDKFNRREALRAIRSHGTTKYQPLFQGE